MSDEKDTPAALEARGWEVMAWTDAAAMGAPRVLDPDAWARFCALAGIDGAPAAPLPAPVCPAPTTEGGA